MMNRSSSCESPLSICLCWITLVNKGKVRNPWATSTTVATSQIFSGISLENPFSVRLLDGSPLRIRLVRGSEVSKSRIGVSSSPAPITSGKIVTIWGLKSNFGSDSFKNPLSISIIVAFNTHSIIGSTVIAKSQKSVVIGLKSSSSKFG